MKLEILSKAPYAYGYDVNEYDEYGNPKVFSKHEEKDGYGNLKGKTCEPTQGAGRNRADGGLGLVGNTRPALETKS